MAKKFRVVIELEVDEARMLEETGDTCPEDYINSEIGGWPGSSFESLDIVEIKEIGMNPDREVIGCQTCSKNGTTVCPGTALPTGDYSCWERTF